MIQLQYQMHIIGAEACQIVGIGEDDTQIVVSDVDYDPEYAAYMIKKCAAFYRNMTEKVAPGFIDADIRPITNDELIDALEKYGEIKSNLDQLSDLLKIQKGIIDELAIHPKMGHENFRITKYLISGRIPYSQIPEVMALDLENYRSEEKQALRISVS